MINNKSDIELLKIHLANPIYVRFLLKIFGILNKMVLMKLDWIGIPMQEFQEMSSYFLKPNVQKGCQITLLLRMKVFSKA